MPDNKGSTIESVKESVERVSTRGERKKFSPVKDWLFSASVDGRTLLLALGSIEGESSEAHHLYYSHLHPFGEGMKDVGKVKM
jgi:hypothetical protein